MMLRRSREPAFAIARLQLMLYLGPILLLPSTSNASVSRSKMAWPQPLGSWYHTEAEAELTLRFSLVRALGERFLKRYRHTVLSFPCSRGLDQRLLICTRTQLDGIFANREPAYDVGQLLSTFGRCHISLSTQARRQSMGIREPLSFPAISPH